MLREMQRWTVFFMRRTAATRQSRLNAGDAAGLELAAIEKRGVENELNPGLYPPCCRAACERAQVFVPERLRDCSVAQPHEIQYFPVVARGAGRDEPER